MSRTNRRISVRGTFATFCVLALYISVSMADYTYTNYMYCTSGGTACRAKSDCSPTPPGPTTYCSVTTAPTQCAGPAQTSCGTYFLSTAEMEAGITPDNDCGRKLNCSDDSGVFDDNGDAVYCGTRFSKCR